MCAHPEIGQVNQSDLGAQWLGQSRSVCHRFARATLTVCRCGHLCCFLPNLSLSNASASMCPSWESRDLCTCGTLWDPLVKTRQIRIY